MVLGKHFCLLSAPAMEELLLETTKAELKGNEPAVISAIMAKIQGKGGCGAGGSACAGLQLAHLQPWGCGWRRRRCLRGAAQARLQPRGCGWRRRRCLRGAAAGTPAAVGLRLAQACGQ